MRDGSLAITGLIDTTYTFGRGDANATAVGEGMYVARINADGGF